MKKFFLRLKYKYNKLKSRTPPLVFNKMLLHIISGFACLIISLVFVIFTPFKEVAILPALLLASILYNAISFYFSYKNEKLVFVTAKCVEKNDYDESLLERISSMSNKNKRLFEYKMEFDEDKDNVFYVILPDMNRMKEGVRYDMMFYKNSEGFLNEKNLITVSELPAIQEDE